MEVALRKGDKHPRCSKHKKVKVLITVVGIK
jgi:hypothetical protein